MRVCYRFLILVLAHLFAESGAKCCNKKTVGSISYTLTPALQINENYAPTCIDECIYTQDGTTKRVCFSKGELKVECGDQSPISMESGNNWNCTYRGSGPMDHWPLAEDAAKCRNDHCSKENAACLADPVCDGLMKCVPACYWPEPSEDPNTCFLECQQAMAAHDGFVDLMRCWGEHHCQESRPEYGGFCKAKNAREGVKTINNLRKLEGVAWTVMAWNCSSGMYHTAGADKSPCAMTKLDGASSLYCFDAKKGGSVIKMKEQSQLNLVDPGVTRSTKSDAKPDPFEAVENHVVDYDDSSYLIIWCGGNQDARFNGAIVVSRHKTIDQIPQETMDRFKANIAARGYDPEDFCTFDNTDCDECTN